MSELFEGFIVGPALKAIIGGDQITDESLEGVESLLEERFPKYRWTVRNPRFGNLSVSARKTYGDQPEPPFGEWEDIDGIYFLKNAGRDTRCLLSIEYGNNARENRNIYTHRVIVESIANQFADGSASISYTVCGIRYLLNRSHIISLKYEDGRS